MQVPGLKESDAWPADPQDGYGFEKLATEVICKAYQEDFGIEMRIARFHNIYGPHGTWKGGREKAPAAFCRKAITSTQDFEVWGDGKQTRSFCYIDDAVEGVLRLMASDVSQPLNIGSEEMVSMNELAEIAMSNRRDGRRLPLRHAPGPQGVRGRNSDNTLIRSLLGWAPTTSIRDGLARTYAWIQEQIDAEARAGVDISVYASSKVIHKVLYSYASSIRIRPGAHADLALPDHTRRTTSWISAPRAAGAVQISEECREAFRHVQVQMYKVSWQV